jgi:hypothetical protein
MHETTGRLESLEHGLNLSRQKIQSLGRSRGDKGTVRAREASQQVLEGCIHTLEKRIRQARRRKRSQAVPVASNILRSNPALLTGNSHSDGAALIFELSEPSGGSLGHPFADLAFVEIAHPSQQIVKTVGVTSFT